MGRRYGYDEIAEIIVGVFNDRTRFEKFGKDWERGYVSALVRLDTILLQKEKKGKREGNMRELSGNFEEKK